MVKNNHSNFKRGLLLSNPLFFIFPLYVIIILGGKMKKAFAILSIFIFFNIFMFSNSTLQQADELFNLRNIPIEGNKPDVNKIDKAINLYKMALNKAVEDRDIIIYKLTKAIDFKYFILINNYNKSEIKKVYSELINTLLKELKVKPNSKYLNYSISLAYGRYATLIGVLTAARKGMAGKIKKYTLRLYNIDKNFENCFAPMMMGRIHFKTPKIPLFLNWPSNKKSKKYLEEALKNCKNYYYIHFFLADTLYKLGFKKRALKYYKMVLDFKIRDDLRFEDISLKNECKQRLKELKISI